MIGRLIDKDRQRRHEARHGAGQRLRDRHKVAKATAAFREVLTAIGADLREMQEQRARTEARRAAEQAYTDTYRRLAP